LSSAEGLGACDGRRFHCRAAGVGRERESGVASADQTRAFRSGGAVGVAVVTSVAVSTRRGPKRLAGLTEGYQAASRLEPSSPPLDWHCALVFCEGNGSSASEAATSALSPSRSGEVAVVSACTEGARGVPYGKSRRREESGVECVRDRLNRRAPRTRPSNRDLRAVDYEASSDSRKNDQRRHLVDSARTEAGQRNSVGTAEHRLAGSPSTRVSMSRGGSRSYG